MRARENALNIIRFDRPDRVVMEPPFHHAYYFGCDHEGYNGGGDDCPVGTKWLDIWGTTWEKELPGVMGFPRRHPLAEIGALKGYEWPNPDDERICGKIYEMAASYSGGDAFLTGGHSNLLWEKAYMLVGMENMMLYFLTEPGFVREVLHGIMDFQLGIARHYLEIGVEMIAGGDDLGGQRGPLFSPAILEEFLIPEYERLFKLYRDRGVLLWLHCCGNVESLIETFLRLGVDILHPVQATANDLDKVRALTQGRMALQGAVNSATVMDGPVERIESEVRERILQLGRDGGYFCGPDQGLPFPQERMDALSKAVERYGQYPLRRMGSVGPWRLPQSRN